MPRPSKVPSAIPWTRSYCSTRFESSPACVASPRQVICGDKGHSQSSLWRSSAGWPPSRGRLMARLPLGGWSALDGARRKAQASASNEGKDGDRFFTWGVQMSPTKPTGYQRTHRRQAVVEPGSWISLIDCLLQKTECQIGRESQRDQAHISTQKRSRPPAEQYPIAGL